MNWFNRIYRFNITNRDIWVKKQANMIPAGVSLLDVGAGSCPYRKYFGHVEYTTHDFEQLDPGLHRRHSGYGKIDIVSDIVEIPVEDGSFDVLLCTEVFEHIPDPIRSIKEMSRTLKSGGTLLFSAPLMSGLHQEPFHFYGGYTPHWYNKFLKESGFGEITIESNQGFFSFFAQEILRYTQNMLKINSVIKLLLLPLTLIFLVLSGIMPLLAPFLDRYVDKERRYTIGYHVKAVKG